MADHTTTHIPGKSEEKNQTAKVIFNGTIAECIAAGIAALLSIIGLFEVMPGILLSASVIILGAALFLEGAAISSKFYELLSETTESKFERGELKGGTATETMVGILAIFLGVLAAIGIQPMYLLPAAIILIGISLILGAGTNARLISLRIVKPEKHPALKKIAKQAAVSSTRFQVIIGIGAIVLGILALINIEPLVLSLVAVLAISVSLLLSSSALIGRIMSQFHLFDPSDKDF